jgi:hypothetical protein
LLTSLAFPVYHTCAYARSSPHCFRLFASEIQACYADLLEVAEYGGEKRSGPISRILSWGIIYLGLALRPGSSDLPGAAPGRRIGSLFGLAPGGVFLAELSLTRRCALTAPFHHFPPSLCPLAKPKLWRVVSFLWHFPAGYPVSRLASALPCGVRTFLSHACAWQRFPGPLRPYCSISTLYSRQPSAQNRRSVVVSERRSVKIKICHRFEYSTLATQYSWFLLFTF